MCEMEAASCLLQNSLAKSDTQVEQLRQHTASLQQAVARGDSDLQADLAANLERECRLKVELQELIQTEEATESLQMQLDCSDALASSLEMALQTLQSQLEKRREQEAAVIPWRKERSELRF